MKKIFTLLALALLFANVSKASVTEFTMDSLAYQLIVDYANSNDLNSATYPETSEDYFGASSYYGNFDTEYDGSFNMVTFASWEEAVKTAISTIVLPANFASAADNDSISVTFTYYNGSNGGDDTFTFVYGNSAFSPVNDRADIYYFYLESQTTGAAIDLAAKTVDITVSAGTDVTALAPTISYSLGASISPEPETAQDFSSAVSYTVTSEKGVAATWTVTVSVMEDTTTPIHDIQYVEDPAANDSSLLVDQTVIVEGLVTGFGSFGSYNKYYVQDGDGEWSGVYVYDPNSGVVLEAGDMVKLTGTVAEYYGVTEIEASKVEILSSRNALPDPVVLTAPIAENLEGVLVQVKGVTITADDSDDSKAYLLADDGTNQYKVFGELFDAIEYEEGKTYDLTGVVAYTYDNFRICPRGISDIAAETSVKNLHNAYEVYPNPVATVLTVKGIEANTVTIKNVAGQTVAVKNVNNHQIDVSDLSNGVYFLEADKGISRFIKK